MKQENQKLSFISLKEIEKQYPGLIQGKGWNAEMIVRLIGLKLLYGKVDEAGIPLVREDSLTKLLKCTVENLEAELKDQYKLINK